MSARFHGVCAAALLCASCSRVVGELDLHCDEQADCSALNAAEGLNLDDDCFVYQCRRDSRGCEKRAQDLDEDGAPANACDGKVTAELDCDESAEAGKLRSPGKKEECDGIDNDCNELIDDGLFGETDLVRLPLDTPGVIHASHDYDARWGLLVALTSKQGDKRSTGLWRFDGSQIARVGSLASDNAKDDNCDEPHGSTHCVFEETAIDTGAEPMLALGINAICHGQLRIGLDRAFATSRDGMSAIEAAGGAALPPGPMFAWNREVIGASASEAAKNLIYGVDRDPASNLGCAVTGAQPGASSPSLELLPGTDGTRQGIALWRAGPAGSRAPLVGLGLWLERGLVVDATGAGHAEALDSDGAVGSGRASVQAWAGSNHRSHFLVYDADAGIRIAYIPALDGASTSLTGATKRMDIPSQQGNAGHATLALHEQDARAKAPRGLAVAWRLGTDDRAAIRFAEVAFDPEAAGEAFKLSEPISLTDAPRRIVDGPVMSYLAAGFASPDPAAAEKQGGWFVAWLEQEGAEQRLVGVRVAELTGRKVEDPFELFRSARLEHLFAYTGDDPLRGEIAGYGFVMKPDPQSEDHLEALNIGALSCRNL